MRTPYDQTLQRLKTRRANNPEYELATRQLSEMSTDLNYAQQSINARLGRQGESINAQIGAMVAQNQSISSIYNKVYNHAQEEHDQRTNQIDNQILQVEGQRDAYTFNKEQENKANKQAMTKSLITTGGTILGGAIGSIVPGAGTMVGASLGSALGNIVANSGIKGTGQKDPAAILQSVADVTQTASGWMTTNYNKKVMSDTSEWLKTGYLNLSPEEKDLAVAYVASGNLDGLYSLMGEDKKPPRNRWLGVGY